jgi:hypothetical protein
MAAASQALRRGAPARQRAGRGGAPRAPLAPAPRRAAPRRTAAPPPAAAAPPAAAGNPALEAAAYGRALATVLNRRLGDAVVAALTDATKAFADAPQRLQEIQARPPAARTRAPARLPAARAWCALQGPGLTAQSPGSSPPIQDEVQSLVQQERGTPPGGGAPGGAASSSSGAPAPAAGGSGGGLPTGTSGDGVRGYNTPPTDLQVAGGVAGAGAGCCSRALASAARPPHAPPPPPPRPPPRSR